MSILIFFSVIVSKPLVEKFLGQIQTSDTVVKQPNEMATSEKTIAWKLLRDKNK